MSSNYDYEGENSCLNPVDRALIMYVFMSAGEEN